MAFKQSFRFTLATSSEVSADAYSEPCQTSKMNYLNTPIRNHEAA